jgi:uncharacterized delta-60 repeat protein
VAWIAVLLFLAAVPSATAAPGDLDPSFSDDGFDTQSLVAEDCGHDVAVQPDGKVVVAGSCEGGLVTGFSVLRYRADGTPDQDFGTDGAVDVQFDPSGPTTNDRAYAVAVQPDGKIVVAGSSELTPNGTAAGGDNFAVVRLLPGGALDPSFNPNGSGMNQDGRLVVNHDDIDIGRDVALGPGGTIYVGGASDRIDGGDFALMKLTPQGALDASYGLGGDGKARLPIGTAGDELREIAIQPDGKVVAAGYTSAAMFPDNTERTIALARFTAGGIPDSSFDDDGKETLNFGVGGEEAYGLAIDAAGRTVVAGTANSDSDVAVARRRASDGAPDESFSGDGRTTMDAGGVELGRDLVTLPGDKIAVAGATSSGPNPSNMLVTQFLADGRLDTSFGNVAGRPGLARHDAGGVERIDGVALASGGRLVLTGTADRATRDFLTARLLGPPLPPPPPSGAGGGGTTPPPPPSDAGPVVGRLSMPRAFAAAGRGGSIGAAGRARVGARVTYTLTEPSRVRFTVQRRARGRKVGRRCVKQTKRNSKRRRCTRYVRVRGSFAHRGGAGTNSFKFSGRLRGRKLRLGRYRLVAIAIDAAGNRSPAKRRAFRIVRR